MYKAIWAAIALTMAVSLGSHGKITGRIDDFVQDTNRNEVSASNTNAIAISENGISYRLYLSSNRTVDSVKNLDSGEWPIQSNW